MKYQTKAYRIVMNGQHFFFEDVCTNIRINAHMRKNMQVHLHLMCAWVRTEQCFP